MSYKAGSICKLNCCQNGRDLPQGNIIYGRDEQGKTKYKCGCPPHYFLIVSHSNFNRDEMDYSKIVEINNDKPIKAEICTAIPLDDSEDAKKLLNSNIVYIKYSEDIIEPIVQRSDCLNEFNKLKSLSSGAVLCHRICRVSMNSKILETIGYIYPDRFEEIINQILLYLKKGLTELNLNDKVIEELKKLKG